MSASLVLSACLSMMKYFRIETVRWSLSFRAAQKHTQLYYNEYIRIQFIHKMSYKLIMLNFSIIILAIEL